MPDDHGATSEQPKAEPDAHRSGWADPHPPSLEVAGRGAAELSVLLERRELSSVELAQQLIARIEAIDTRGPALRSVLELAPDALEVAAALDAERATGRVRGPLHGIPVLVKDNIDTVAPLHTTAGSLVFGDHSPGRDASLVSALRDAGVVVLGKTNLSEWANFRGRPSSSGWSAAGGQTRNPHVLDRSPGGSSAGSGAAVAARLGPLAVGTETDGSILCPSAVCGIAGLKPTVGLISRTGVVPISCTQDTAGPMARSAHDLALLLEVLAMAVDDDEDHVARAARRPSGYTTNYASLLGDGDLSGVRIGAVRDAGFVGYHLATDAVFESALEVLATTGAKVVDPITGLPGEAQLSHPELTVLTTEFRTAAHAYFERRAGGSPTSPGLPRTLDDVLAHAWREPAERTDLFGTDLLAAAAATNGMDSDDYTHALEQIRRATRTDGLDKVFGDRAVDVLVAPTMQPSWPVDHVLGDRPMGAAWSVSAVAGYPSATLPVGMVHGLPVGLALLGPPWSEALLLRVMFALERALGATVVMPVPRFVPSANVLG